MKRHVCIHGHFYQPPRENPWTGRIDVQPTAAPFPDWNHRITAECYRPNTRAAILDRDASVAERLNNLAYISFDFGPTLLRWLEAEHPQVHDDIVLADRMAIERTGHGCAMAQAFHHAILPLCSPRDRRTEIRWGIADFWKRFQRAPEGMWLPETAVSTSTLEVLAEEGVAFTLLAPRQAAHVREIGSSSAWQSADGLDCSRPYRVALPSGRSIVVFFYDGPTSQGVAFEGLLHDGARFARRLVEAGRPGGLVSIATDGESYGHHHRHGEMALAFALKALLADPEVELTHYAAYLARHPATWEVRIIEPSSWSCAHGVGRWSDNCGCAIDPARSLQQTWRAPLRAALSWLRDQLDTHYVRSCGLRDPWSLRDTWHEVGPVQDARVLALLEMQNMRLMMFTSCGWFFDDPAGLETVQILRYAWRALDLHEQTGGPPELRGEFLARLEGLHSREAATARELIETRVESARRG